MATANLRCVAIGVLLATAVLAACSDDSSTTSTDAATDVVTDVPSGDAGQSTEYVVQTGMNTLGPQVCDTNNHCLGTATWQSTVTGDWQGSLVGAGPAALDPADPLAAYASTSVVIFSGTIEGCGDGSVVLHTAGRFEDPDLDETWEIVPGFSTGDLVDITGNGTTAGTRNPDFSYDSESTGEIVCDGGGSEPDVEGDLAFTLTGPGVTLQAGNCDADGRCVTPYSVNENVAGAWSGTTVLAGAVVNGDAPTEFTGSGTFIFEGTIDGCGTGTAVVKRTETGDAAVPEFSGVWEVVEDYGTGDLASLTGNGTVGQAENAEAGTSAFTGGFDCG